MKTDHREEIIKRFVATTHARAMMMVLLPTEIKLPKGMLSGKQYLVA
jgi:hypothetical protein